MQNLPTSIAYIQIISNWLAKIDEGFEKNSNLFKCLQETTQNISFFDEDPNFYLNKQAVIYLQLLLLTALTMHGGISMPILKHVSSTQDRIDLVWAQGYKDSFNFGYYNDNFKQFVHTFSNIIQAPFSTDSKIPVNIITYAHQVILVFSRKLMDYNSRVNYLKEKIYFTNSDIDILLTEDFLFLILSAFPAKDLADILYSVGDIIPDNATHTTPDGYKMKLKPYFKQITQNIDVLIQKLSFLCELFFLTSQRKLRDETLPILKTQLTTYLTQKSVPFFIKNELRQLQRTHIECRMGLYGIFLNHLQKVLPPISTLK